MLSIFALEFIYCFLHVSGVSTGQRTTFKFAIKHYCRNAAVPKLFQDGRLGIHTNTLLCMLQIEKNKIKYKGIFHK